MKNHFSKTKYMPIFDYVKKTHPNLNLDELLKSEFNQTVKEIIEDESWASVEYDQRLMDFLKKHTKSPRIAIESALASDNPQKWGDKRKYIKGDEPLKMLIELLSPCVSRMSSFVDIELIDHKSDSSRFMAMINYEKFEESERKIVLMQEQEILETLASNLASIPLFKKGVKFDTNYSFEDYIPGEHSFLKISHKKVA